MIGLLLALAVGGLGTIAGLDRDRAFYPTITIVVASYYVLFAVMGSSSHVLLVEAAIAAAFLAVAIAGFRNSLWVVVVALALHGVFDLLHGQVIANPGVPVWWPAFCLAFDGAASAYLASLLVRRTGRVQPPPRLPQERNT
jgi:hypothetical protein